MIGDRIKEVRSRAGLNQLEFGKRLNLSQSAVANYEKGARTPIDAVVSLICTTFSVNEAWLRTGEGEPFIESSRDEAIEALCQDALRDEDDSFRRRFIAALAALDVSDLEVLEKFVDLIERNKKEKPPETDRDRIIRELDRELQEEERLEEESGASTAG